MHFYIDESGHTGTNLFDPDQPMLYYGVLSSDVNIDLVAQDAVRQLCRSVGAKRLHAAELGVGRLLPMAGNLSSLQKRLNLRFDLYRVAKADHAIICFFDQVFDHGLNPAITWSGYWTPMRYVLLLKLASLFNEEMARVAWEARICVDVEKAQAGMRQVCEAVRARVHKLPDARSRELITDALLWAEKNPGEIQYNVPDTASVAQVTPNIIGFQSVMMGIANRVKKHRRQAARIVVDRQTQFNKAQKTLADFYAKASGMRTPLGPGMPEADFRNMPTVPIEVSNGDDSAGLQLTDLHLWCFKRMMEGEQLPGEFRPWMLPVLQRGHTDEISLNGLAERWTKFFEGIPELDEMSEEQRTRVCELIELDESRRQNALRKSGIR